MRVTIIADASHDPSTQACGWAWWLASNRGEVGGQGHEIAPVFNSTVAETVAIFRSLSHACRLGLVLPGDSILIQTDCDATIKAIEGKRRSITDDEKVFSDGVNALRQELDLVIKMRHVKGHTSGYNWSTRSNNMCDRKARFEMLKAQEILKFAPL